MMKIILFASLSMATVNALSTIRVDSVAGKDNHQKLGSGGFEFGRKAHDYLEIERVYVGVIILMINVQDDDSFLTLSFQVSRDELFAG